MFCTIFYLHCNTEVNTVNTFHISEYHKLIEHVHECV